MGSAEALRQERGWSCLCFLLEGRDIEYSLLCLQRVNAGNVVAWDVALFPGGQGPSFPPFPSPERQEGAKGSVGSTSPRPLGPLSFGLEYLFHTLMIRRWDLYNSPHCASVGLKSRFVPAFTAYRPRSVVLLLFSGLAALAFLAIPKVGPCAQGRL